MQKKKIFMYKILGKKINMETTMYRAIEVFNI